MSIKLLLYTSETTIPDPDNCVRNHGLNER